MPTTTNFGWTTPADTDLVKDGALAIRTLGNGIDTSFLDLKGGTTGQNLRKNSNTDLDFTWAGDATNTVVDAEGDLLVGDAADTLQRLPIGSNGHVLTVDTTVDGKIKWAAAGAGGGKILQVLQASKTNTFTTSSGSPVVITDLSISITPSSASSKILVMAQITGSSDTAQGFPVFYLYRGASAIFVGDAGQANQRRVTAGMICNGNYITTLPITYLDSPNTTSATTYAIYTSTADSAGSVFVNRTSVDGNNNYNARSASTIIVMEVGA